MTFRNKVKILNPPFLKYKYDWEKPLAVKLALHEMGRLRKRSIAGSVLKIFRNHITHNYKYELVSNYESKVLLFYGKWNYREDHFKVFSKFSSELQIYDYLFPLRSHHEFHIFKILKLLILSFIWFWYLTFKGYSLVETFNVIPVLTEGKTLEEIMEKMNIKKYSVVITYYDVSPDESIFIQYAKMNQLITCTLQHGIFAKKDRISSIPDTGVELEYSISDYYLAWNAYTYDEAMKCGRNPQFVKVLGNPKFIGYKYNLIDSNPKRNLFGVILNNSEFDYHNRKLIAMANSIAEELNLNYVIRYHPVLEKDSYIDIVNPKFYEGVSPNNVSIFEYSNTVDFTIISSSSIFVDLLFLDKQVYRLVVSPNDTYSSTRINAFGSIREFIELHSEKIVNKKNIEYLTGPREIANEYKSFISSILEE